MDLNLKEAQLRVHRHIAILRSISRLLNQLNDITISRIDQDMISKAISAEKPEIIRSIMHRLSLTSLEEMPYQDLKVRAQKKQLPRYTRMNRVELIQGLRNLEKTGL
jgi:hypothetical protein